MQRVDVQRPDPKHSSETAQDNQTKGAVRRRCPGGRQETQLTLEGNASQVGSDSEYWREAWDNMEGMCLISWKS